VRLVERHDATLLRGSGDAIGVKPDAYDDERRNENAAEGT
jgi:hypothetical protein